MISLRLPALAALLALAFSTAACDRNLVTAENAARLKPGMPESEVKAALGEQNYGRSFGVTSGGVELASYNYQAEKLWVRVDCRDGKVVRVLTRDPARKVAVPARNDMSVLDLSVGGPVAVAMRAAFEQGGVPALAEWMKRELVPGRPAKAYGGRDTVIADRFLSEISADGVADFGKAVLAPQTDEHLWFTTFTSGLSSNFYEAKPPVSALILVAK